MLTRARIILAILANACLIAIPVTVFTNALGSLNFLAGTGLSIMWVAALIVALAAGTSATDSYQPYL